MEELYQCAKVRFLYFSCITSRREMIYVRRSASKVLDSASEALTLSSEGDPATEAPRTIVYDTFKRIVRVPSGVGIIRYVSGGAKSISAFSGTFRCRPQ